MKSGDLVDDRFRIVEQIGAGGMGVVYRARDERDGGDVAVKLIRANTAEEIRRAMQEIELLGRVAHPAIVRHLADGLTDADQLYLAMEWIDGVTLGDRMYGEGFTLREAVAFTRAIAAALGTAHAADIVHRDIKPSNILLEGGDPALPRIIDFGLARVVGAGYRSVTRTGTAMGTPGYMSPEQARGLRGLTPATDVFALAVVLYECASGRAAFTGGTLAALMINVVLAEPVPLESLVPEAPAALCELVARALSKDPAKRPRDGAALAAALGALGEMPDGPRRDATTASAEATIREAAPRRAHCLVMASAGLVDDALEPPSATAHVQLIAAATAARAQLEVLATGVLVAHLEDEPREAARRAAELALALQAVLPGWTFAVSTGDDAADALPSLADSGMAMLARAAKAALFAKAKLEGITVDAHTAALLDDRYLVLRTSPPRLAGRR